MPSEMLKRNMQTKKNNMKKFTITEIKEANEKSDGRFFSR